MWLGPLSDYRTCQPSVPGMMMSAELHADAVHVRAQTVLSVVAPMISNSRCWILQEINGIDHRQHKDEFCRTGSMWSNHLNRAAHGPTRRVGLSEGQRFSFILNRDNEAVAEPFNSLQRLNLPQAPDCG
jgi:hypothetical protein